jgi:hypothetical protein
MSTLHTQQYNSSGRKVLSSGGLNHLKILMSTYLDPSNWAYERPSPTNNETQWTALVAIQVEVSSHFEKSLSGPFRYFMVLIEAATRWSYVCLIPIRNHVFAKFMTQVIRLKEKFPKHWIQSVWLDNAT